MVVDRLNLLDHREVAGCLRSDRLILNMGDRCDDRGRVERRAVVEGHALPELDLDRQRIDRLVGLGEDELHLAGGTELHQGVVDRVDDRPGILVVGEGWVERIWLFDEVDRQPFHERNGGVHPGGAGGSPESRHGCVP